MSPPAPIEQLGDLIQKRCSHPVCVLCSRGDGLETLREMKAINADLPVLIHTYHDSARLLSRSFHLGACGYLVKGGDKNALIDAVRRAAQGCNVWNVEQIERIREADTQLGRM